MKELNIIQTTLKAPKGQYNSFGKYKYRSCEDIMEALKPLLKDTECVLVVTDEVATVGDFVCIKATATITNKDEKTRSACAYAGVEKKKGMDLAQTFGSSSSYARKYALNGLFCIDDNEEPDMPQSKQAKKERKKEALSPKRFEAAISAFKSGKVTEEYITNNHTLTEEQKELLKDAVKN